MLSFMQRVHVVGCTGSGKTTLARRLATRLEVPHVELDALFWGPDWTPVPLDIFRSRVTEALQGEGWTVDGNYSRVRDLVWERADTVVWLDYSFPVVMGRLLWRTLRRVVTREQLWNENREDVGNTLFSRDSILLFAITSYGRRKRTYTRLFEDSSCDYLNFVRLRSPAHTRRWLESNALSGA